MNSATLRAAIALYTAIKTYGPLAVEIIGDITALTKKLEEVIEQWHDHPALTDAERADLERILAADRTTIGLDASTTIVDAPAPVATNDKGFPINDFNRPLDEYPDVSKLDEGDVVWQQNDGKFYVAMHGFGFAGVPGPNWRQLWPSVTP